MPSLRYLALIGLTLFTHNDTKVQERYGLPGLVMVLADESLPDVAVAVYSPYRGIIYYNPVRARRLGPELTAFFRAHEFGHLYYHHTRSSAMAATTRGGMPALVRASELQADCYAARTLAASRPGAVDAAVRFFLAMGPMRLDEEHPDGTARANRIQHCSTLPPPTPR